MYIASDNKKIFRQKFGKNINIHFMLNDFLFVDSAICGIIWKSMVEPDWPKMKNIRRSKDAICMGDN